MITIEEALTWLNYPGGTNLSEMSLAFIKNMSSPHLSTSSLDGLINSALAACEVNPNPLEYQELLLACGVVNYYHHRYPKAWEEIGRARKMYTQGSNYVAISSWMLGCVEWALQRNGAAFLNWDGSRKLFEDFIILYNRTHEDEKKDWYQARWQLMNVDLACTFEEAYTWLNQFDAVELDSSIIQIRNKMVDDYKQKKYDEVIHEMSVIQRIAFSASDYLVYPQILVDCALLAYQMDNQKDEAIRFLKQALMVFTPHSHQQAVVRWMIGMVEWLDKSMVEQAVTNWQQSREIFLELSVNEDHANRQDRRRWYKRTSQVMRLALEQKINQNIG
jgi:tetratricopeptide (TPR) repeat protein